MNLRRALLAAPLLLLVLSGCSSGGSSADVASGGAGGSGGSSGGSTSSLAESAPEAGVTDDAKSSNRAAVAPLTRSVISTGQVTTHARDVADARAEVVQLVAGWGGTVADEETGSDDRGQITDSTMTLRVPTARFDAAMDGLAKIGEVEQQSRASEDVSTEVIDNQARVRAGERSIASIERLLTRATKLSDIIAIESDLARRQADLDSLKQQEAYLADQTSLSTINVHLSRTARETSTKDDQGFLAGLGHGWDGLRTATAVGLTAFGAVLPFAAVLALVGGPLWIVVRRRRPAAPLPATAD